MQKATACVLIAFALAGPFIVLFLASNEEDVPVWNLPPQRLLEVAQRQPYRLAKRVGLFLPKGDTKREHPSQDLWQPASPQAEIHPPYNWTEAWQGLQILGSSALVAGKEGATVLAGKGFHALVSAKETWDGWEPEDWQTLLGDVGRAGHEALIGLQNSAAKAAAIASNHLEATSTHLEAAWETASLFLDSLLGRSANAAGNASQIIRSLPGQGALALEAFWETFRPGGKLHPATFLQLGGHIYLELTMGLVIVALLAGTSSSRPKPEQPLSEEEIDALCEEWQPEPLFKPPPLGKPYVDPPVISSIVGREVIANNKNALNMASFNFLGIAGDSKIMEQCHKTIDKYGVGSCGPRGFYGTIDVHLQLEERLAKFMRTQETIIYSYDLATVPSVLPAFANAKDLILCDEGVAYPIQNGAALSRARVQYFRHNDMQDLEAKLEAIAAEDRLPRNRKKPLNRRFIVVEGLYQRWGDLAPLAQIYALKERYKYRLVVDETLALGVLGASGRGACEHAGLAPGDAEIVCASLGNALASVGGFCAGDREIVDHQRLSGLGYCFSASLPPYLATAAIGALDVLETEGPARMQKLRDNASLLRERLPQVPGLVVVGSDAVSPVVHLTLDADVAAPALARSSPAQLLQSIADEALNREGVLVTLAPHSPLDLVEAEPSLRVIITSAHSPKDVQRAAEALKKATRHVLGLPKSPGRSPERPPRTSPKPSPDPKRPPNRYLFSSA